jgi:hypothetical protein
MPVDPSSDRFAATFSHKGRRKASFPTRLHKAALRGKFLMTPVTKWLGHFLSGLRTFRTAYPVPNVSRLFLSSLLRKLGRRALA